MQRTALITGITGQDGSYLTELLLSKGYKIYGLVRKNDVNNYGNIRHIHDKIEFLTGDLNDTNCIDKYIDNIKPDEIYNLGALSHVGTSWNTPITTTDQTGIGAIRIFEAVKNFSPKSKVYQASTSELYGKTTNKIQNENTPICPTNPYAAAKALAHFNAQIYRHAFGLYISTGVLFNHESPRRRPNYVTRKISLAVATIKLGLKGSLIPITEGDVPVIDENRKLQLGNLNAKRDWGYAGDYVEAMWSLMQLDKPNDFVVATGVSHTIKELCEIAFSHAGLNWQDYVVINQKCVRPTETGDLIGNYSKINQATGWKPKTSFEDMIKMMVDADIKLLTP